jgi:phosphoribosylglycinamide formyltransferase-1
VILSTIKLAVLISGSGRTLKNFIDLVEEGELPVDICLVISSAAKAKGLEFAAAANIPTQIFDRAEYASDQAYGDAVFAACRAAGAEYVALAGFLKLVPVPDDFANRVVNIHPALLPAFGGKGMYGDRVHQAVLDAGMKITGCTVHFVDNKYDNGPIIWQQPVPVFADDTAHTLAARVFEVEKEAYPHVLKLLAGGQIQVEDGQVRIISRRRSSDE